MQFTSFISTDKPIYVAVSGGVDSILLLEMMRGKKFPVIAAHYNHGNHYAEKEEFFVREYCRENDIDLIVDKCVNEKPVKMSKEEFWRKSRMAFFYSLPGLVATGHNLNDAVEWYLFSALNGEGHYIDYQSGNMIKPLLIHTKSEIIDEANKRGLEWLEDPSNQDTAFARRNFIRHSLLPQALQINPGLFGMVRKRIIKKTLNS